MNTNNIKYLTKDFDQFRESLIELARNYYPNTYKDFNESSPGMMFIEMAAMVGDVLSFYSDKQLQESFINLSSEKKNVYNLAQNYGFKPKNITPSQVDLEVKQLVPAKFEDNKYVPNMDYALHLRELVVSTKDNIQFYTIDDIDFKLNTVNSPLVISVYEMNNSGVIQYFLLTKKVKAISGNIDTLDYEFTTGKKYDKIVLDVEKVSDIISVTDSDENVWYEVDYLSQDLVPMAVSNTEYNDPELSVYASSVPYILCYKQVARRYITRLRADDTYELQFGAGLGEEADEEIVPNPMNVGIGIDYFRRAETVAIDPNNFLNTKTYGQVPSNTTITIKYATSNGLINNVKSGMITDIISMEFYPMPDSLDTNIIDLLKYDTDRGIKVNNSEPAYGGINRKPLDVIKREAIEHFSSQNRAVTREDYIIRTYSMPAKYGAIAKAYIDNDTQVMYNASQRVVNQNALNLYVLAYNDVGNFVPCNLALKRNLIRYLNKYRLLTDAINIKDAFIINVGIKFDIVSRPGYNSYEVILRCIDKIKSVYSNYNMEINKPIIISNLYSDLDIVEGVQTVSNVEFINLVGGDYSENEYDLKSATRNNIIYPSLDPCVFEIKFPDKDIVGRTINN